MTTAARPTFDPARGKDNSAPTLQYSARDIASHTKLKFRQPGQGTTDEIGDRERLKEELRRAELEYYEQKGKDGLPSVGRRITGEEDSKDSKEKRQRLLEEVEKLAAQDKDDDGTDSDSSDSSSEDDDDDDDDNTAELMATLKRIREEKAEERERLERLKADQESSIRDEQAKTGNPLLDIGEQKRNFKVERRWDDDVIFKNQARGVEEKPKKRFINDMLRSDFHRRFLHKYVH